MTPSSFPHVWFILSRLSPMKLSLLRGGAGALVAALCLAPLTADAAEQFGNLKFATPGPTITTLPMQIASEKGMDKAEGFAAVVTVATGSVGIKAQARIPPGDSIKLRIVVGHDLFIVVERNPGDRRANDVVRCEKRHRKRNPKLFV